MSSYPVFLGEEHRPSPAATRRRSTPSRSTPPSAPGRGSAPSTGEIFYTEVEVPTPTSATSSPVHRTPTPSAAQADFNVGNRDFDDDQFGGDHPHPARLLRTALVPRTNEEGRRGRPRRPSSFLVISEPSGVAETAQSGSDSDTECPAAMRLGHRGTRPSGAPHHRARPQEPLSPDGRPVKQPSRSLDQLGYPVRGSWRSRGSIIR